MNTEEDETTAILRDLDDRKRWLKSRRTRLQQMYYMYLISGVILLAGAPLLYKFFDSIVYSAISVLYGMAIIGSLPLSRARFKDSDTDIQELEFEADLLRYSVSNRESRAEKLLRMNQTHLRRYYDLNLSQNIWVFGVGLFCIVLGIAVVGSTIYMVITFAGSTDEKIIVGIVGSIGTLLTNYVAAVYLKMHSAATSNLAEFHSRLVGTHQLLLGNLIASRIDDDEKRWATLSKVATNIAKDNK